MPRFKLRTRFTLILSSIFIAALIASWLIFSQALQREAEAEIRYRGMVLMALLGSVRSYTSNHVNPLLVDDLEIEEEFISESVPAFSASTVFNNFRSQPEYSDFMYKEAALNPTNPQNRADPFEESLLITFRSDPSVTELSGFTTLDGQQVFYNARPLTVSAESCLRCHSTPENAPASLIRTYGSEHGFGWQLGEIIAARTLYVPAQEVFEQTQQSLRLVMGIIVAIFAVVIIVTNAALRWAVVRPVIQIARLAQLISADRLTPDAPEVATVDKMAARRDEFGDTSKVLQKMTTEIYARMQKLKLEIQSLRIQVDSEQQAKQVEEITESDYFKHLQSRVREIRRRDASHSPVAEPVTSGET